MTVILHEVDAEADALAGQRVAIVGYVNQGRSWALNLRDSGADVAVCVRADVTRETALADGFVTNELVAAGDADVVCLLVPDDIIPTLPLSPRADALVIVASGYTLAFGRLDPTCDVGMVAPSMLGPEVRRCYLEGVGFMFCRKTPRLPTNQNAFSSRAKPSYARAIDRPTEEAHGGPWLLGYRPGGAGPPGAGGAGRHGGLGRRAAGVGQPARPRPAGPRPRTR